MHNQRGSVALLIIVIIVLLGGVLAFVAVSADADAVHQAEDGIAMTIGFTGDRVGALAMIASVASQKNKS